VSLQQRLDQLRKAEPAQGIGHAVWAIWYAWVDYAKEYAQQHPEAGMPATITVHSDCYPATIARVGNGRVWVKRDRIRGPLFIPDARAPEELFVWSDKRKGLVSKTRTLHVGERFANFPREI